MREIFKWTLIVIVACGFVFSLYFFTDFFADKNKIKITEPIPPLISDESREYKNLLLRFSLAYPKDLQIKEYNDGTSASTITFEDVTEEKGFQIFVVPYAEAKITKEQFKRDLSSGIFKNQTDILIDNVFALAFESRDDILGETREIWFINYGFLYEVTAPKEFDDWLFDILKTWRFIPNS